MASEEDNFAIDIYGDGDGDNSSVDFKQTEDERFDHDASQPAVLEEGKGDGGEPLLILDMPDEETEPLSARAIDNEDASHHTENPQPHGIKRKETSDGRSVDPGASNALLISDLHWYTTEDDIRGWANEVRCEDELKEVTFSEHKVNGKSKGQAYVEFASPQASTAVKHKIESLTSDQPSARKFSVIYSNHHQNPFKTLPKDAPARAKDDRKGSPATYTSGPGQGNFGPGFRGGRGGGFNRGGYNSAPSFQNRNFSGPMGGYNNTGGFQGTMPMMNTFGGYNRGGMGGMRGGRGGMGGSMMPVGGMPMAPMGMNPMMANMGFQGSNFNPAMFNQVASSNPMSWNQHAPKRQRQE